MPVKQPCFEKATVEQPHRVGWCSKGEELRKAVDKGTVFVAADGAVGACFGRVDVLCVVTDLDGEPYLSQAVDRTTFIVHAHGDNVNRWKEGVRGMGDAGEVFRACADPSDRRGLSRHAQRWWIHRRRPSRLPAGFS